MTDYIDGIKLLTEEAQTKMVYAAYTYLVNKLKTMEQDQLNELFHDINDIEVIKRISDCAYNFVENYEPCDPIEVTGQSEYEEAWEIDHARRVREMT